MEGKINQSAIVSSLSGVFVRRQARAVLAAQDDDTIIELVRNGDTDAFRVLVKRYEDFVFTLINGLVHSDDQAADIAQEVFLRAYRSIRRFEKRSSFKTWLYRISYNTALSHINKEKKEHAPIELDYVLRAAENNNHTLKLTVQKLMKLLKPELKAVIIFHYYDDLKYEEIADIMNCPVGTVKIWLFRAKLELKKLWVKYAV